MRVPKEVLAWNGVECGYHLAVWYRGPNKSFRVTVDGPAGTFTKPGLRTEEGATAYARRIAGHLSAFDADGDNAVNEAKQRFLEEP